MRGAGPAGMSHVNHGSLVPAESEGGTLPNASLGEERGDAALLGPSKAERRIIVPLPRWSSPFLRGIPH